MCKLTEKFKGKSFTGYKLAMKKDGKYYSPATGIEYKPGKVKVCKRQKRILPFDINLLDPGNSNYEPLMVGKTSVFKIREDCEYEFFYYTNNGATILQPVWQCKELSYTPVILKMTISGDLYEGEFHRNEIIAGNNIKSMEECVQ